MSVHITRHTAAMRRLATRLVRDHETAADVVQEAETVLARRGGRGLGYALGIVRNLSQKAERSRRTRARHEGEAAIQNDASSPATDDLVAQHEVIRELAAAVSALREPYRQALVMRFYEDLPPRTIAAQLEIPVATVRTRIQRALGELQADMDRRCRGWRLGLAGLIPNAPISTTLITAAGGIMILKGAVLVLSVLALWWWLSWDNAGPLDAPEPIEGVAQLESAPGETTERRTDLAPESHGLREHVPSTPFELRVVDPDGRPVSGATVWTGSSTNALRRAGRTDALGRLLDFEGASQLTFACASLPDRAPGVPVRIDGRRQVELVTGNQAAGRVVGQVVAGAGRTPVPGARVVIGRNEPPSRADRDAGRDGAGPGLVAITGGDGRFEFDGVLTGWFRLGVLHPDWAPTMLFGEAGHATTKDIVVRLRVGTTVQGEVRRADGRPLANATIIQGRPDGYATRSTQTDDLGRYVTPPLTSGQRIQLRVEGRVRAEVRLPRESTFVWNPIAGAEPRRFGTLRCAQPDQHEIRVLTQRGTELARCTPDASGSFRFSAKRLRNAWVIVTEQGAQLPRHLQRVEQWPADELVIRLDARQGMGRVLLEEPPDVGLRLRPVTGPVLSAAPQDRRWQAVPGGTTYRIDCDLGPELGWVEAHRLEMPLGGGDIAASKLATPQLVAVDFAPRRHPSATESAVRHVLERIDDNSWRITEGIGVPQGPRPLPDGRYRLEVEMTPGCLREFRFEVSSSSSRVEFDVDARPAVRLVPRGSEAFPIELLVRDESQSEIARWVLRGPGPPVTHLAPGAYVLDAVDVSGRTGSTRFVVSPRAGGRPRRIEVTLGAPKRGKD